MYRPSFHPLSFFFLNSYLFKQSCDISAQANRIKRFATWRLNSWHITRASKSRDCLARVITRKKWSHERATRASYKLRVTFPPVSYQATVRAIIVLTVNLINLDTAV